MANNRIQIKRNDGQATPSGLLAGELAWSDNNASTGGGGAAGYLYIGDVRSVANGGTAIHKIGGPGWGTELLTDTTLLGTPLITTTPAADDNSLKIASTAYVDRQVSNAAPAMNDISDATVASETDADLLVWNDSNSAWENKALSGHVAITAAGVATVSNVADGIVTLGTKTSGAYVSTVAAGDNITITGAGGEGSTPSIALSNNVTIAGNLTVSGTTTTVESSTVSVSDPVFVVGGDVINDTTDRGISFKWNDDDSTANAGAGNTKEGFFGYDKTDGKFKYIMDASNSSEQFSGTLGDAAFGDIEGTLTTASQPNITGVGTIATGVWNGTAIPQTHGGTGGDSSSASGVAVVTTGNWTYESNLDVGFGGTGLSTIEANAIVLGNGAGNMTVVSSTGNNGKVLRVESGVPTWSDTIDAGTF